MWEKAERFLIKDNYLGPVIKKHGHCTIKPSKKNRYFLDLVESIMFQQLSGKAAETIVGRLRGGLGGKIIPEAILKLKDKDFRSWGVSRQKSSYLRDLSQKTVANKLQINKLNKLSDEEVVEELVQVKGIGRWTAEMFLMFSLGRPDIFPADDLGIGNGIKKLTKRKMNKEKMEKFAECWKPYRTIASWYVWKSLEN